MPRHCKRFGLLAALTVTLWGVPSEDARAYDDQAQLDLSAGYVAIPGAEALAQQGAIVDVGGGLGVGDMFMIRAGLGYGAAFASDRVISFGRAHAEGLYIVDVLQLVPFFGLGAGAWLFEDDGYSLAPNGFGVLGVDYLLDRTWTLGLDVRTGAVLLPDQTRSFTEGELRVSRIFDLF